MNISPCYKCNFRTKYCHTECESYAIWIAENEVLKGIIKKNKNSDFTDSSHKRLEYISKKAQRR